ncbi:UDP-Glycosyltransferase superfamily protein [Actinidia rufa]|uniref:UDP-Glycosyltransferase superfamily protein n=1 Tax=Actinidia rufa TaxID=165716 RepID=A0A7J0F3Q4_9ERIC|nr:UDP-Glycosyltransferase superfamily protein [Actinidia rufa]
MSNCVQAPHALVIPSPFQGHVTPFVHLAIKLATKGFIITFINTQIIHHQISQANSAAHSGDIFAGARESGLDIRYATFSDGFPLEFDRKLHEEQYMESILNNFYGHVDKVVGELLGGGHFLCVAIGGC